jgi:hypothetical protein
MLIAGIPERRKLVSVLRQVDRVLGRWASAAVVEWGVEHLYVVPHRDLAFVPFWALPSLQKTDVTMADSVAGLAEVLAAPPRWLGNKALVVADPTRDLPIARLQSAGVGDRLAREGFQITTLVGKSATRPKVVEAIGQADLLHFVGHGRRDALRTESSALMAAPREGAMWLWAGPLLAILEDGWTRELDGARTRVIPEVGRITEWDEGDRVDRLAETDEEIFFGSWFGGKLRFASELITAEELAVTVGLDRCAVVILMACETGGASFRGDFVHEPSGLVEALQLAGARTIIATAWPVRESSTLLLADILYEELLTLSGKADVSRALRIAADGLRRMTREGAANRLERLAEGSKGSDAFRLRALADRVGHGPRRPFGDPIHWASFHVVGAPFIARGVSARGEQEGGEHEH